jgi:drug/metabolite transporter (DMT)-like permease
VSRERQGILLCVAAAAGFGAMAVLAKLAYAAGAGVVDVLTIRFALAAAVLGALAPRRARPRRGALAAGLGLGAVVYAAEAGLFFAALTRMDAAPAELLLYVYPTLVVVGAIVLGREAASRRRLGALALASSGVVLVLLGGRAGAIEPGGAALAVAAAAGYAAYVLIADRVRTDPRMLAALVCAGAAASFGAFGLVTGQLGLGFGLEAWGWIAAIALVSTVVPLAAFLAGMERIGPGRASILSTLEPPLTVALAWAALGESLAPLQLAGGGLVVAAVALIQLRGRLAFRSDDASAHPARPAAARPVRA